MFTYKRITGARFIMILLVIFLIILSSPTAFSKPPGEAELQLIIIPAEATLTTGEQLQFRIEIKNNGNIDISKVEVQWQAMGGIGEISPTGLFTASDKPGRGMVRASAKVDKKELAAYALVKVAEGKVPPGAKKRIVVIVRPDSATVPPGGIQKFEAEPAGDTQWRVIPPMIGSITPDGVFTASRDAGKGIVVATVQTKDGSGTGRADIIVGGGKTPPQGSKLKLNIKPKHTKVDRGGSVDFEADVIGLSGQYPLEWEVNPAELGNITGTGSKVVFTAGNIEGRGLVTVKLRTETEISMDWATVDVGGPGKFPPVKVIVTVAPQDASIKVGDSMRFTADITGNVTTQPSWSVSPKKIGTIDANGMFTATAPGWGLIIAKVDTGKGMGVGQSKVFVSAGTSIPLRITISPEKAETSVNGDPVKFTAQVTDKQGNQVTDMPIIWKVVPGNLGSIDQTGLFVPGSKPGHALITAKVEGAKGSGTAQARVTITSRTQTGKLNVSINGPASLKLGGSYSYTVSVTDSEGVAVELGAAEINWRVVPSTLGALTATGASATFIPEAAGRGVIMAEVKASQGTGTGRISITVDKK